MRVLLYTGKGGVGKTTLALASALGAAAQGHRVCVVSTDPAHSLSDALGRPVGAAPVEVAPGVVAQELRVLHELDRAWSDIQGWLRELLREETDEMVAEELLVFPGMEELVSLRAVREIEETGDFDVCILDCAPTGATLRMLRFPDVLRIFMRHFFDLERRGARLLRPIARRFDAGRLIPQEAFFEAFERLYIEVDDVRQILLDDSRTSARLVVNPARVVVDEARRSFAYLSLYGVATDAVLVNRLLPPDARRGYFAQWAERETAELADIEQSFPVAILRAPLHRGELVGLPALEQIADEVFGGRDPADRLTEGRPIRLGRRGTRPSLQIDLPGVSKEELDVHIHGRDLHVRARDGRRCLALPDSMAGREIVEVALRDGVLEVVFGG